MFEDYYTVGVLTLDETQMLVYDSPTGEFSMISLDDLETDQHSLSFYIPVPIGIVFSPLFHYH